MDNMAGTVVLHHHDADETDVFGFWLYILTDCILFSALFATFLVVNHPAPFSTLKSHIELPYVLKETFVLLASNFTFCLASLSLLHEKTRRTQFWLFITFLLGATFVGMELNEFYHLATGDFSWNVSAQASAFFTLVGTHGLHVSFGLLWILILFFQFFTISNLKTMKRRMTILGLFWNFLDIVWIFVFSIVYLMGAM